MTDQTQVESSSVLVAVETPTPVLEPQISYKLPSVSELFHESWDTLKARAYQLFVLMVMVFGIGILIGIATVIFLFVGGIGGILFSYIQTQDPTVVQKFLTSPVLWISASIVILFASIAALILSAMNQIAMVLVIGEKTEISAGSALKKSIPLIIPVAVVQLLTGLLVTGGFFLFIIPGLIFSLFFAFAMYEAILNGKKGTEALRRSIRIVSLHFGEIIVRWLAIMGVYIGIIVIIPSILNNLAPDASGIFSFFSFFINILLGWFAAIYWVTLYKQLSTGLVNEKGGSLLWFTIIGIVGWIVGFLLFAGVIFAIVAFAQNEGFSKAIDTFKNQKEIEDSLKTFEDKFTTPHELKNEFGTGTEQFDESLFELPPEIPPAY